MKTYSSDKSLLKLVAVAALLSFAFLVQASDKSVAAKKVGEVIIPKSTFVDDPRLGKDPFFPNSTRRLAEIPRIVTTNAQPTSSLLFTLLYLKGISGTKAQPLAIINGSTVAPGEAADIRSGGQIIKIRCLEIRESSVLLELDGSREKKELKLREGI